MEVGGGRERLATAMHGLGAMAAISMVGVELTDMFVRFTRYADVWFGLVCRLASD